MFIEPSLGFVVPFAGNHPPAKWMFCMGQELPISEYDDLFVLLGTTFGGDGINTFALPNFCGRIAVHAGQGLQQNYTAGKTGGSETALINLNNLPVHTHQLTGKLTGNPACANSNGTTSIPTGHYPAILNGSAAQYSTNVSDQISMAATTISSVTPQAPVVTDEVKEAVSIMSPFLTMNYIICVAGIYPSHG
jgi:microcystin-dependent protein